MGACHHDCPDTCVWDVTVVDGVAVKLRGNPKHPTTAGELCPKVNRLLDRVYHPDRITTPLRRVSPKGDVADPEFAPIGWDQALGEMAARLDEIIDHHGGESILQFSFDGTQGLVQKGVVADRFFDAIGASDIDRHLCGVTAWQGAADVSGIPYGIDPEELADSKTILLWGTNTRLTNRHLWPTIQVARSRGATVTVIDPIRTQTAAAADRFVQLRPGTDVALVLGLIHMLQAASAIDTDWVLENTTGAGDLLASAQDWTPERTAATTGVCESAIRELAHEIGVGQPVGIRVLVGPEHREHGREIMAAIAMLAAVTGSWRHRGGGLARSTQVYFEQALNLATDRPARRRFNMASLGQVLNDRSLKPPIQALVVHNSNPAVICPDQNAVVAGLSRPNLFTVVIDQFMTDTARFADIVLPCTSQVEHLDLAIAWGHMYLALNRPAIDPVGDARSNAEIFRRLAESMTLTASGLADSDEQIIRQLLDSSHPWLAGIDLDRLMSDGWARLAVPDDRLYDRRSAPTSDGRLRLRGLEYKPGTETPDGSADLAARYPLTLLSRKQHAKFLNAGYGGFAAHLPNPPEPQLEIHAVDAAERGIESGDRVTVTNDRGSLTVTAKISDDVTAGLVALPFGWWHQATPQGRGVNALTNPTVGPDGGSAHFHETLVQVTHT